MHRITKCITGLYTAITKLRTALAVRSYVFLDGSRACILSRVDCSDMCPLPLQLDWMSGYVQNDAKCLLD